MFGVGFYQGYRQADERIRTRRAKVNQAFQQWKADNPYATAADFQNAVRAIGGGDFTVATALPGQQAIQRMAADNQRKKQEAEQAKQFEAMERKLRYQNSLMLDKFITNLSVLRKKNSKIIFDFNIRIKRWSKKNLNLYLNKILPNVDILFCSGEDLVCWKKNYNIKTFQYILKKFNIYHAIYRKNEEYNYSFYKNKKYMIKNKPIKKVVDTSGAGDGYNAAYLSSFIISNNPQIALNEASKIGAKIVMKKGAIVNVK